jgi:hypothetical protein
MIMKIYYDLDAEDLARKLCWRDLRNRRDQIAQRLRGLRMAGADRQIIAREVCMMIECEIAMDLICPPPS